MEHTSIVTASDLAMYAQTRESEAVVPELIWMLVNQVPDITLCRIPYGGAVNQPGLDGLVQTEAGFSTIVPKGKSFWEISTASNPQAAATENFKKRTKEINPDDRGKCTFVFVTARGSESGGGTSLPNANGEQTG
jgi:hypothetical protein